MVADLCLVSGFDVSRGFLPGECFCTLLQNGENSLHYAATITERQKHYPTEDRDMMRLLLAHGGDVGAETKTVGLYAEPLSIGIR